MARLTKQGSGAPVGKPIGGTTPRHPQQPPRQLVVEREPSLHAGVDLPEYEDLPMPPPRLVVRNVRRPVGPGSLHIVIGMSIERSSGANEVVPVEPAHVLSSVGAGFSVVVETANGYGLGGTSTEAAIQALVDGLNESEDNTEVDLRIDLMRISDEGTAPDDAWLSVEVVGRIPAISSTKALKGVLSTEATIEISGA